MNHTFVLHLMLTFSCAGLYFVIPENPNAGINQGEILVARDPGGRDVPGETLDSIDDPKVPLQQTGQLRRGARASERDRENQEFLPLKVRGDRVEKGAASSI
ncbi:MAG: hypothetical protein PHE55_04125 [Methylococcaceae bacterium]|nr:hypothetical protein [Methylococcaceae bacterium]